MDPTAQTGIPVLGAAWNGLRLDLVMRRGDSIEDLDDPFVPLNDAGRFSRVLLGRIVVGEDTTFRYLAIKVQRNSYRPPAAGFAHPGVTNRQIDEIWQRERGNLERTRVPEVVSLLDMGFEQARSLPVTFCKKTREYFHPLCRKCLNLLVDCRDDTLLRDCGLTPYSTSTARYIYCETCASSSDKSEITFYTYAVSQDDSPKEKVRLRRRSQLYRDGAAILAMDHGHDMRDRLTEIWPCFSCSERSRCYPAEAKDDDPIPAESLLVPLSYYEFEMLPFEVLHLHYDEFVDLLGGAPWSDVESLAATPGSNGRRVAIQSLRKTFVGSFQYLHRGDGSGLFAVEVLRLKLAAFSQLCHGLQSYHACTGQPHLGVGPSNVMVQVPESGNNVAARWNFQIKLIDLGSALRLVPPGEPAGVHHELMIPAPDAPKAYLSPLARQVSFGPEIPMRLTVHSLEPEDSLWFEAEAHSSRARLDEYRLHDIVRILPNSTLAGLENLALWGSILEFLDRGVRLTGILPKPLKGSETPFAFDATVSFFKRLHVPCDLYSLGMLLFRSILVNDHQDTYAVEDAVHRVCDRLNLNLSEVELPDFSHVANLVRTLTHQEKEFFDKAAVLFRFEDRDTGPNMIPALLWNDLMIFGFRLTTNIPGFSFCADHGDYPHERPEAAMDKVLVALDVLNARLHVELFGQAGRNREIADVCKELITEIGQGELRANHGAPDTSS